MNIIDKPVDFVKNYFAQLTPEQVSKKTHFISIFYSFIKHSEIAANPMLIVRAAKAHQTKQI